MIQPHELIWGIIFPLLLSAAAMLLEVRPWRRDHGEGRGGLGAAIGICGGFAAAFIAIAGMPRFPPLEAEGWLVYLEIPLILIAALAKGVPRVASAASVILLCAAPWLLLRGQQDRLGAAAMWRWIAALAAAFALWWVIMEMLARRSRGGSLPLLLAVAAAIVMAPIFVLWTGEVSLTRGGILALALLLPGLLVCGHFFADLTIRDMVLLALAPLAAWAGELPGLGRERAWKRVIVRTVAVLIVLAFVAVPAGKGLWQMIQQERTGGTPSESI